MSTTGRTRAPRPGRRDAPRRELRRMHAELESFLAAARDAARAEDRRGVPARPAPRPKCGSASRSPQAIDGRSRSATSQSCGRGVSRPRRSRGALSAARSFFAHQVLLGAAPDNPAAEIEPPRRRRKLPRTLSPARGRAADRGRRGHHPARASRLRARRAPLRRRAAGQRGGRARARRRRPGRAARPLHRQGRTRSGSSRSDAPPPRRSGATSRAGGRTSTGATARSCS